VVSVITKDGIKKDTVFNMMLESTLRIPYTDAIIVDDSNDDVTSEYTRKFMERNNKHITITKSNLYGRSAPTRATARQTAIDIFLKDYSEDFLVQLDDDVVLRAGWWDEALGAFEKGTTGLFYGVPYDVNSDNELLAEKIYPEKIKRAINVFSQRGGTNDIALRRKALDTVRERFGIIPPELHLYEDAWLLRAIECSGYTAVIGKVGALQYDPLKVGRSEVPETYDADLKYIRLASKYGIIKSTSVADDIAGILVSTAGLIPWSVRYAKKLGVNRGIATAFKRQQIKVLYRYVKVRSALGDTCKSIQKR
jgi:hypothetical protein